jgi:hypothetical protein
MPSVNGKTFDNVKLRVMGLRVNAERFDYNYGREASEARYDDAGNIIGVGRGAKKLCDVTMEMLAEYADAIEDIGFVAGRRVDDLWPFPITVEYWNNKQSGKFSVQEADAVHTRALVNCSIEDVSAPHARKDTKLVRTFKMTATDIA